MTCCASGAYSDNLRQKALTERLYDRDPYLRTFDAAVIKRCEVDGHPAVVLDRTAFYPTGGGQPNDTGTLNGIAVIDVQLLDNGDLAHILEQPLMQDGLQGEINWPRRFDHMQQHTGQHILSQAFIQAAQAETVSFHLGSRFCTIDLNQAALSATQVAQAIRIANQVVMDALPVYIRLVGPDELPSIPLRKPPAVTHDIRVVQVGQFDWSACGGTHVCHSGQVGAVQVVRTERRKQQTRIYFMCGWRALADYAHKQEVVQTLAAHLTTSEDELMASVQRIEAESQDLRKKLIQAQKSLLNYELPVWLNQANIVGGVCLIQLELERDLNQVQDIAQRLTEQPLTVALLAAGGSETHLIFACSPDVQAHMGRLMQNICAQIGGRGGGRPQFAQGRLERREQAAPALHQAAIEMTQSLEK